MPDPVAVLFFEGVFPLALEGLGDLPAELSVTQAHAHQMALLRDGFAVDKALPPVKHSEIVDEVHISGARLDLQLSRFRNGLDCIECFNLTAGQRWQVRRARMDSTSQKSSPAEIHDELRVLVEENRAALESRTVANVSLSQVQVWGLCLTEQTASPTWPECGACLDAEPQGCCRQYSMKL